MALTEFQRGICRLIAARHRENGASYVAGGVALNTLTGSTRVSRDIDLFHDTAEAVGATWAADRSLLERNGCAVTVQRERTTFVEATVSKAGQSVVLQWTLDSAFRFFPLMEHDDFGLTLHPFDLATNKVLALVGRLEVRDWVDVIQCHGKIQRLGLLAWAACGKDPGFSPAAILDQAGRSSRYSATEVSALAFSGQPPDAATLSKSWHAMLDEARELIALLPPAEAGKCVLDEEGNLFQGAPATLATSVASSSLRYHAGSLRGAWPQLRLE